MTEQFTLVIICGLVALLYGVVASKSIISADAENEMREIASAIQEGAAAYLNRQYITISVVGIVVTIILAITLFCSCDRFCHWGRIIRHSWICWDECLSSRKCAYSSVGYRWF